MFRYIRKMEEKEPKMEAINLGIWNEIVKSNFGQNYNAFCYVNFTVYVTSTFVRIWPTYKSVYWKMGHRRSYLNSYFTNLAFDDLDSRLCLKTEIILYLRVE